MPEVLENNSYEEIGKNIDNLDSNINNLGSKIKEREDFTKYFQEVKDIYNKFILLNNDINDIADEDVKKKLKEHLDNLKVVMLNLVSIDNVINGKTNDMNIDDAVGQINIKFHNEMENLINNISLGGGTINAILSDESLLTESKLVEIAEGSGIPYGELSVDGKSYPVILNPYTGDMGILDNGKLQICELDVDGGVDPRIHNQNSPIKISYSESFINSPSKNNDWVQRTWKFSEKFGNGFSGFISLKSPGSGSATPWLGLVWRKLNTQLTASYSPGGIKGSGWAEKEVYKFENKQTIKIKKGFDVSIAETLKTGNMSEITIRDISAEVKASYRLRSNLQLSGTIKADSTGNWSSFATLKVNLNS